MNTLSNSACAISTESYDLAKLIEPVKEELQLVEEWLATNMIDDSPFITELLSQVFKVGGKRIRPVLALLCSKASLPADKAFSRLHIIVAVLTELIHAASLVHDDVIDKAELRRGIKTVNRRFDDRIAVLLGDLLFAQASICLARIMNPVVVGIYGRVLGDLCAGEIGQMRQHFSTMVNWDNYITKSTAKTASLFAAASHAGAILNAAPDAIVSSLKEYGLNLGLCFQIIDDLLDVTGDASKLGKVPGSDLKSGVITAPALFVLERQDQAAKSLAGLITSRDICSDTGAQEGLSLIVNGGGVEATIKLALDYANKAKKSLVKIAPSIYRDTLSQIVDYVTTRVN